MADGKVSASRPALILLSGLPGAGKTTLAARLADELGAAHVESDRIRRELVAKPRYEPREHARVFARAERLVHDRLRLGRVVVFDATNLAAKERRRFLRAAANHDATLVAVRVTAPPATIHERLSRPRSGYSEADLRIYEQMRGRAQPFTVPVVVIDTRFDLAPSIALIRRLLEADRP